jgi:WD40 repeat protein/tRNA A-37 threonylcarbamoyl transferase component Bud32
MISTMNDPFQPPDRTSYGRSGDQIFQLLIRQRTHWQRGQRQPVEAYLDTRIAADSEAVLDLISNEVLLRREAGELPTPLEYQNRFPHLAAEIARQFEVDEALDTTDPAQETRHQTASEGAGTAAPSWPIISGYRIESVLGRGGMGVVYKAMQQSLNRLVALKMLASIDTGRAEELARFRAEAELVAGLQHPNIVQVYEIGEENGQPFLSMEYVAGGSLAQALAGKPQPPELAARCIETLAEAMRTAHLQGIVHRDLKPANILLSCARKAGDGKDAASTVTALSECVLKITDFGLAKRLHSDSGQTKTGDVLGTPSYMAPEQAAGKTRDIGPAADIYALGAVLYELLTGRPPFAGTTVLETLQQVQWTEPVSPRRLQPKVPRDLETICLKCLRKEPRERYESALALAEDLRRFQAGEPIRARPLGRVQLLVRWCRRNPALALAASLAIVAVLAVAVVSVVFAIVEADKNIALTRQQRQTEEARAEAQLAKEHAQRVAANLALDHGLDLCDRGDQARGMLWLARALELAPAKDDDLRWVLRNNMAAWGQTLHPLKAILTHRGKVLAVAFSPDGKYMVTASADGTARLWDTATGQPHGDPLVHDAPVIAAAFSPDSRLLVTSSEDHTAKIWDVDRSLLHGSALDHPDKVWSVAFSHDSTKVLTGCEDGQARVWDADTGKSLEPFLPHHGPIHSVAFSPDGKTMATASFDGTGRLWDAESHLPHGKVLEHAGKVWAVTYSADSRFVATASDDRTVVIWYTSTGRFQYKLPPYINEVHAVAFSPDSRFLLSGSRDSTFRLWDVAGPGPFRQYTQENAVLAVGFSPDGRYFATASRDKAARVFLTPQHDDASFNLLQVPWRKSGSALEHEHIVGAIAFGPDSSRLLTGSWDGSARLWHISKEPHHAATLVHEEPATAAVFAGGDLVATTGDGGAIRLWDQATRKAIQTLRARDGASIACLAATADHRRLLSGAADGKAQLWDLQRGKLITTLDHSSRIRTVDVSPDGRRALTGGADGFAKVWRLDDVQAPLDFSLPHESDVTHATFSPDGKVILTASKDHKVRLWDVADGRMLGVPLEHPAEVWTAIFAPRSGRILTGCEDGIVRIWDRETMKIAASFQHHGPIRALACDADERTILIVLDPSTLRRQDLRTGKLLGPPFQHGGRINSMCLSADGRQVLTASGDKTAQLWNICPSSDLSVDQLRLKVEVDTGMELDHEDVVRLLDQRAWQQRRQALEEMARAG